MSHRLVRVSVLGTSSVPGPDVSPRDGGGCDRFPSLRETSRLNTDRHTNRPAVMRRVLQLEHSAARWGRLAVTRGDVLT